MLVDVSIRNEAVAARRPIGKECERKMKVVREYEKNKDEFKK